MSISVTLRKSLIEILNEKNKKKKDMAREISTSQQSLSGWTSQNNIKPVTIENALRLSDHSRGSTFTMEVIHQFFGIFRTRDEDIYRRGPSSLDRLRKIGSNEGKALKHDIERTILKNPEYLSERGISKIVAYASEYLDEIIVGVTLLSSLCNLTSIDIRYLSEQHFPY